MVTPIDVLATITAAEHSAQCTVAKFNDAVLFPLIALMMAIAFLVFLWGCLEYIRNSASDQGRALGQQHILYGTIGMLIMVSAYSILSIAAGTFGITLFDSERVACGPAPTVTTDLGIGGGFTGGIDPGGGFTLDDVVIPGVDDPITPVVPTLPVPGEQVIDELPYIGPTAALPACPEGQVRYHVSGRCSIAHSFEFRDGSQIEVDCLGDFNCTSARMACTDHYGGVDTNVMGGSGSGRYLICGESNFSGGPARSVVYENAPVEVFNDPVQPTQVSPLRAELVASGNWTAEEVDTFVHVATFTDYESFQNIYGTLVSTGSISQATYDALYNERFGSGVPGSVADQVSLDGSVAVGGETLFVSPAFETNYEVYVESYAVQSDPDEAALLTTYAEFGVTEVLFMIPVQSYTHTGGANTQIAGSDSQQEARCEELGGEFTLESGNSRVTSVNMYACLR